MHRIIYNELCLTEVRNESRQIYRNIITGLAEAGAEGIVLGCTEIELLVSATDSPVPVFPTTRLHVEAAVEFSLTTLKRLTPHGPGASHTRILNCDSNARCLRHEHASGVPPCLCGMTVVARPGAAAVFSWVASRYSTSDWVPRTIASSSRSASLVPGSAV